MSSYDELKSCLEGWQMEFEGLVYKVDLESVIVRVVNAKNS